MINKKYITHDRSPFFELAREFIKDDSVVLDIGCGNAAFSNHFNRNDFYLFDANETTIEGLKLQHKNVCLGLLPSLPYPNDFFDIIHCSHVVEHLESTVFYNTLVEMDRCLKRGGCLIISAPLMWSGFYNDLSHVRPYNPRIYNNYLCGNQKKSRTRDLISTNYKQVDLVYRYLDTNEKFDSFNNKNNRIIIFFIKFLNEIKKKVFVPLEKTGYTIILKKG